MPLSQEKKTYSFPSPPSIPGSSSFPATSLSRSTVRGGGLVGLPDVVKGASVFILTKTVSVCAGPVGNDRVRLEDISCSVTSHSKKITLKPGIYVAAQSTQYSKRVAYLTPVGDISLVQKYKDYLMTNLATSRQAWTGIFDILTEAPTVKFAMNKLGYLDWKDDDTSFAVSTTPLKSVLAAEVLPSPSLGQRKREELNIATALVEARKAKIVGVDMDLIQETLQQAQTVVEIIAQQSGIEIAEDAPVKMNQIIAAAYRMSSVTMDSVNDIMGSIEMEKGYNADVQQTLDDQLRSLQAKLQKPMNMYNEVQGDTVWDAIYYLQIDQASQPTAAEIRVLEADVTDVRESFDSLHGGMLTWSREYNQKLEEMAGAQLAEENPVVMELKKSLLKKVEELVGVTGRSKEDEQFKEDVSNKLKEMASQLKETKDSYELDDVTIYDGRDVLVCLNSSTLDKADFGSIVDPSSLLYRVNILLSPDKSAEELVTGISRAASQNLSMDEVFTIASHNSSIPPVFSAKNETGVTEIKNLKTYEDFRCRGKRSGLADRVEECLPIAEKEIRALIDNQYGGYELTPWRHLANTLLITSVNFIRALFQWADETYAVFHSGGNSKKDSWWIISYVIKNLFTRYFAPVRVCSHRSHFATHNEKASEFIWSAIKSYNATQALLKTGIKDHPIVVGAFAEWLVHNSGRKEAVESKDDLEDLKREIKELKNLVAAQKKTLTEVGKQASTAKTVADRAMSKAASGSN